MVIEPDRASHRPASVATEKPTIPLPLPLPPLVTVIHDAPACVTRIDRAS